ncbi:MAG: hypothetical protein JNM27_03430 [Leptospirales bacterium]|nr:hypothetical protein [Leptospirales bacterium]
MAQKPKPNSGILNPWIAACSAPFLFGLAAAGARLLEVSIYGTGQLAPPGRFQLFATACLPFLFLIQPLITWRSLPFGKRIFWSLITAALCSAATLLAFVVSKSFPPVLQLPLLAGSAGAAALLMSRAVRPGGPVNVAEDSDE